MSNHELGNWPHPDAGRDATHIAIVPVIAAESLWPGYHIGVMSVVGKTPTAAKSFQPHIGIVDPFLKDHAKKGQRFYLCLYPGSVTGLCHVYQHPVLDGPTIQTSQDWVAKWGAAHHIGYEELMAAADLWVATGKDSKWGSGEYWIEGGRFEGLSLPEEFWDHYDRIRMVKVPQKQRDNFFSCSC